MISPGLCIDLETTLAGRIPDSVRPAGEKRYETRIIEIGAVLWHNPKTSFGCIVNPISSDVMLKSASDLSGYLRKIHQKPENTIDFWSRVLVKRKSVTSKMLGMAPAKWLRSSSHQRMEDFVRWHNDPTSGPGFVSETTAMRQLKTFSEKHDIKVWFAHNGNSFDFKVLQGCAQRTKESLPDGLVYVDTLKVCRRAIPNLPSYSQPILYKSLFKTSYNAHVAIDDAHALARICAHVHAKSRLPVPKRITRSRAKSRDSFAKRKQDSFAKRKQDSFAKRKPSVSLSFPKRTSLSRTNAKKSMSLSFPSKRTLARKLAMALTFARRMK